MRIRYIISMTSDKRDSPKPFITVALPTYNRPEYLRLTLKSCLEQDYPHFEIVISDDSKDDQVRQIVESFRSEKIRYIKNNPPLGIPSKLNDLVEKAAGPWMVILGDDDLFEPGYLSSVAALIENHADAALIRTRSRLIDENGKYLKLDELEKFSMTPYEFMTTIFRPWYEIRISITGFAFPVKNMKRLGGFLDFYQGHCIDRVAWAMLAAQGMTYFEPAPLVTIRANPVALSNQFIPDYKTLLDSKKTIFRIIDRLYNDLAAKAPEPVDRENMKMARAQFFNFMVEDSVFFLDKIFIRALKQKRWFVHFEVKTMFLAVKTSDMPFFSLRSFHWLALYYLAISVLPMPLRVAALSVILKCRHALMILFPPKTFSIKSGS